MIFKRAETNKQYSSENLSNMLYAKCISMHNIRLINSSYNNHALHSKLEDRTIFTNTTTTL